MPEKLLNPDHSKSKKELIEELELLRAKLNAQDQTSITHVDFNDSLDNKELTILLNAAAELGSTLNLDSVMQVATNRITELADIDTAAIYLVNENDVYLGAATPPIEPSMPGEFRWAKFENHKHIKKSVDSNEIVCVPDAKLEDFTPEEELIVNQLNLRSVWYIPISHAGEMVGVFIIASRGKCTTCSARVLQLCNALSNLVAIALQNSLLHKELQEKHEELSTTLYSIGDAVISTDINGNVAIMNPNAERLCGYSIEEAKGKPLTDIFRIINSDTRAKVENPVNKVLKDGKRVNLANHTVLVSKTGEEYQISDSAAPILDHQGNITGVVLVFADVTSDYLLRDELQKSKDSLVKAELMGGFGSWEIDLNEGKVAGSAGAASIYGVNDDEFNLTAIQKIPLPEFRSILDKAMNDLVSGNKPYDVEFQIERPDGQIRTIHSTASYNKSKNKVFGIIHDITERKESIKALEASEYRYKEFFEKDLTGDFLSTVDGRVIDCNPAFLSILGYSSLEEIQRKSANGFYDTDEDRIKLIERLQKEKEIKNFELHLVRSDGNRITVIENIIGVFDENNILTHLRGYLFDITDRKKAEEDMLKAKEKAETADRMKTEFLAQMSHEIRSPLNAVLSFTGIVKELTAEMSCEDLETSFSGIESASRRIIRTVDSILNMSDLQLGTYKVSNREVEVVELLGNLVREFNSVIKNKKVGLLFNTSIDELRITIDEYALSQVVVNLIDNAIKYTKEGHVELKLQVHDKILIQVKDTGIGISKSYLPNLFTPFTQEEQGYTRSYEGNGLGLALVKKYCELIDAEISVSSKKNEGSTFTLELNKI